MKNRVLNNKASGGDLGNHTTGFSSTTEQSQGDYLNYDDIRHALRNSSDLSLSRTELQGYDI